MLSVWLLTHSKDQEILQLTALSPGCASCVPKTESPAASHGSLLLVSAWGAQDQTLPVLTVWHDWTQCVIPTVVPAALHVRGGLSVCPSTKLEYFFHYKNFILMWSV